jgi:hypothetical protein
MRRVAERVHALAASSRKFVETFVDEAELLRAEGGVAWNARGQRAVSQDFRQWDAIEQYRKEAERARETGEQVSAGDRAFWLALTANWEKLAKEAEAPKIRP